MSAPDPLARLRAAERNLAAATSWKFQLAADAMKDEGRAAYSNYWQPNIDQAALQEHRALVEYRAAVEAARGLAREAA